MGLSLLLEQGVPVAWYADAPDMVTLLCDDILACDVVARVLQSRHGHIQHDLALVVVAAVGLCLGQLDR
ncbi:hypothetical protein DYB28_010860 [Aphanomyces astaci]|uniref:Uncharacterized protein n=1 Tax=Aphanomyces astaci TaxID=112090 RepID=A0A9X8E7D4_APHAT|nr:hypothetical protein DYB28_010860 [Aphanomyces astaci]